MEKGLESLQFFAKIMICARYDIVQSVWMQATHPTFRDLKTVIIWYIERAKLFFVQQLGAVLLAEYSLIGFACPVQKWDFLVAIKSNNDIKRFRLV